MARGILTGKFASGKQVSSDNQASHNRDRVPAMIEQAEAIRDMAGRMGITMGQLALRHSITPVGVSAAIPGARTIEQLEQNVAASNGVGLSDAQMAEIADIQSAW
jgi:aryl-alcohol dehydrogenase-like predicted oxidoreductase